MTGGAGDAQPADRITLDALTANKGGWPPPAPIPLRVLGWRAFRLLMSFVALSFMALTLVAWSTYPSLAEMMAAVADPGTATPLPSCAVSADPVALWRGARAEWLAGIKELGQVFIVTPLLPLIGTVLGYLFGREQRSTEE